MTILGNGQYRYELIEDWGKMPPGESMAHICAVGVDSKDRLYAFQREKEPPILVFDPDGNFLTSWGHGSIDEGHGIHVDRDDIIYLTDRNGHTALKYTSEGKQLLVLGTRGKHSDTGATEDFESAPRQAVDVTRAAEPFNRPTKMAPSPSGDLYVSDGYSNSRVHRFSADGKLKSSWGQPGKTGPGVFFVPHCVWIDSSSLVYICDRENHRIQIFNEVGDFINQWTDFELPTCIYMDSDETVYVSDLTPQMTILDKQGNILSRWECPIPHWIYGDSKGDFYMAVAWKGTIAKFVKQS